MRSERSDDCIQFPLFICAAVLLRKVHKGIDSPPPPPDASAGQSRVRLLEAPHGDATVHTLFVADWNDSETKDGKTNRLLQERGRSKPRNDSSLFSNVLNNVFSFKT